MNKKKFGVILAAVLFAALVAVVIWYIWGNGTRDGNDRVYVEKVSTVMGNMTGAQNRYSGVVEPQKTIDVNTDSERTVKDILVKVGDKVEVGTPLFNYDTEETSMELEQAKLELENQDIEISNFKTQIAELEKEKKAAAEEDKFEYTTQIQTLETQIKQAEFEKSSKKLEIDKLQKKMDDAEVVSTAAGTIKTINDGESESMDGSSSAFMTILSTGDYRIKGSVNEQNIWLLSEGADVIVRSRVDEDITWTGRIESIAEDEPSTSSGDMDMGYEENEGGVTSSSYPFYVTLDTTEGLMLGQHILIELDQGQMDDKDGIWLYSGYIVFEDEEGNEIESLTAGTEGMGETEYREDFEEPEETETSAGADFLKDIYFPDSTEMLQEFSGQTAYVWADDGNGRLEKRAVVLGAYDPELDEYEIISGLTADDMIAWPMEGLYEGIITVTSMDDIDYSSGLYQQQMGTEELWYDTESDMMYDDMMMDDMMMDEEFEEDYYDEEFDEEDYEDDMMDAEVSE